MKSLSAYKILDKVVEMSDVNFTSLSSGDIMYYVGGKWTNASISSVYLDGTLPFIDPISFASAGLISRANTEHNHLGTQIYGTVASSIYWGGQSLPNMVGSSGMFLTTNGSSVIWSSITNSDLDLDDFAPIVHTHIGSDVTTIVQSSLVSLSSDVSASSNAIIWSNIYNKPLVFNPDTHTHEGSSVTTAVQSSIVSYSSDISATSNYILWNNIGSVPSTFVPSEHTHNGIAITSAIASSVWADTLDGYHASNFITTNYYNITKEPTGFPNRYDSTIAINTSTGGVSIYPTVLGGSYDFYVWGNKFTKTVPLTSTVPNTHGMHFVVFDSNGNILNTTTPNFSSQAFVASIYANGTGIWTGGDERHGVVMDWNTHEYLHKTVGVRYHSGFAAEFADDGIITSLALGALYDEDMELAIPAQTSCGVLYRYSISPTKYTWTPPQTSLILKNNNIIQYDLNGTKTDVPINNHVAYWVFGTNNIISPIFSLMGQRVDVTLANSQVNNTFESLSLGDLPSPEMKLLYRVIYQRTGATSTWKETKDYRSANLLSGTAYLASSHGNLTGLTTSDDHPQYLRTDGTRDLTSNWTISTNNIILTNGNITAHSGIFYNIKATSNYISSDGTTGATDNVAVAKDGGGTRTLVFKNGLYTGYIDS